MDLKDIMLSEIRHRKINTTWYNLYVEAKIQNEKTEQNSVYQRLGDRGLRKTRFKDIYLQLALEV